MKYLLISYMVLTAILWLWSMFDIFFRIYKKDPTVRLYWILWIIFAPPIGSLLYFHHKHRVNAYKRKLFQKPLT